MIIPMAAKERVESNNNPIPRKISTNPVTLLMISGLGNIGGMILMNIFGFTKCIRPAKT